MAAKNKPFSVSIPIALFERIDKYIADQAVASGLDPAIISVAAIRRRIVELGFEAYSAQGALPLAED